ncbi:uncharacterized protein CPUR_04394 [Claviceps purpurea 20.1]|uniref:Protein kinase domain-containing protein n=1 Tax=Claviceps purpurea (strain 20.1) TaxID=1111077 RepID=M1W142_CLAP2|nr:uncharacterized protein CPUR_04394 [Claviceps purpurea 20.1]
MAHPPLCGFLSTRKQQNIQQSKSVHHADRIEIGVLSQMTHNPVNGSTWEKHELLVTPLLDHFEASGPNGIHQCLVTIPPRCCLSNAKEAAESMLNSIDVASALAAQLATVLSHDHVHYRGYAHGDLNLDNVFLQFPSLSMTYQSNNYTYYTRSGKPVKEPVVCRDPDSKTASADPSVPSYGVKPMCFVSLENDIALDEAKLLLSNFGVAFRPEDNPQFEAYTRLELQPART